jgi:hypothetical protein
MSDTAKKERSNKSNKNTLLYDKTQIWEMSSNGNNLNKLSDDKTCMMPKSSSELRSLCQTFTSPNVRISKKPKSVYHEFESISKMPSELMSICQTCAKSKMCYTNINVKISHEEMSFTMSSSKLERKTQKRMIRKRDTIERKHFSTNKLHYPILGKTFASKLPNTRIKYLQNLLSLLSVHRTGLSELTLRRRIDHSELHGNANRNTARNTYNDQLEI